MGQEAAVIETPRQGTAREVAAAFLKLGLTSFGGPVAHLAYFRKEFVEKRKWLDDSHFSHLLALCQFLPGPASSQLGFALGLLRAGWGGALAAFLMFTLPSALLMFAFAVSLPAIAEPLGSAAIHGLKLVALVVVSQAVLGMTRQLCPDARRATIAALAAALIVVSGQAWMQLVVIAIALLAGMVFCRNVPPLASDELELRYGRRLGLALIAAFVTLLVGLPLLADALDGRVAIAAAFYRAGALVFGGGHVVLPLLREAVVAPGWLSATDFLAGYGGAQAIPGPMFTLSAYLGARLHEGMGGPAGALTALCGIFLPGFLLLAGVLPFWGRFTRYRVAAHAVAGANAAVVGILGAALYDPVWVSAIERPADVAIAIVGFALLTAWRVSPLLIVAWCVMAAMLSALL
ncbi:MAG TPA: chromate efflux transporter [Burkholderiales bacterium]|nr:chromate efflux transporter [Burkholderiales bacterium]